MNPLYDILFATILLTAGDSAAVAQSAQSAQAPDAWIAEDKIKHATISFAATAFVQAGARSTGVAIDAAVPIGAGVAAIAGIAKEVHDRRNGGSFSARDLAWDALGIIAGVMVTSQAR